MAVSFTMLAFACWYTRHPYWAGGFAGLALLSGQALIPGLAGLGLAVLMNGGRFWNETETPEGDIRQGALRPGLVAAGVFFLGGSLLLLIPRGPSAALADIAGYFTGWASFSQVPVIRLLGATVIYQPFAIIFGLVGLVYGVSARSRFAMGLGFWLLTALTLALIYPSRQVADLVWALIPLSALAALGLDRALDFSRENLWESLGLMFLTVTLLGFAYLNFNSLAMASAPPQDSLLRWGFFIGTIIMLGVVVALVALGWSAAIARRGALWGIVIALGVYTVSAAMGAAGIREGSANELWRDPPAVIDADLLAQSLDQLSVTNRGTVEALPITIYGVPSASLLWLVREWDARYLAAAPTTTDSPLIIGPLQANPAFGASYRGQDFIWRVAPFWERATWNERLRWLASRQIPRDEEKIILWARTDLFPGGQPAAP
jgi:hypothetical protein